MPLDISKLTRFDIGREVTYESGPDIEHGHISSWDEKLIFVHFHRGSTAASCQPESLRFSNGGYNENGGESVAEILDEIDTLRAAILKHRELAAVTHEKGQHEVYYGHVEWLKRAAKLLSGWSQQLFSANLAERSGDSDG